MDPRKASNYIEPTAEALNKPFELVDKVVAFYWKEVRQLLASAEEPSVTITNLGVFKVKPSRLEAHIVKYQSYIDNLDTDKLTFRKHAMFNSAQKRLGQLNKMKEKLDEEKVRRAAKQKEKQEYESNKTLEK